MPRYKLRTLLFKLLMLLLACGLLLIVAWQGRGCPFRNLTGIPCPGCGMSRAWFAFLRLELADAFRYHPMFWSMPVLMGYCFFDGRLFRKNWLNFGLLGLIALGVTVNHIVNLIAFFNGTPIV